MMFRDSVTQVEGAKSIVDVRSVLQHYSSVVKRTECTPGIVNAMVLAYSS
jgi:hypothetical protein